MAAPATMNGFVNVVNDSASPVGKGWNIPGVLRLFSNSVSGVPAGMLLAPGDGSSWHFTQGAERTCFSLVTHCQRRRRLEPVLERDSAVRGAKGRGSAG